MSDWDFTVVDVNDKKIEVGNECIYGSPLPEDDLVEFRCKVIEITEPDGDVDDDTGRTRLVPPFVKVEFVDGVTEQLSTYNITSGAWHPSHGPDEWHFQTDDLAVEATPKSVT
jgi:hypothetical protein